MKLKHFLPIILLFSFACGGGDGDSSPPLIIAGIDASEGCGEFDGDGSTEFTVLQNTCPFELNSSFDVVQNGCSLRIIGLTTDGSDLFGVVNEDGNYGVEFFHDEEDALYECASRTYDIGIIGAPDAIIMRCQHEDDDCEVVVDPIE